MSAENQLEHHKEHLERFCVGTLDESNLSPIIPAITGLGIRYFPYKHLLYCSDLENHCDLVHKFPLNSTALSFFSRVL